MKKLNRIIIAALVVLLLASCSSTDAILIEEQGFFAAGGSVYTNEGQLDPEKLYTDNYRGQSVHGDHATVEYQIPLDAKEFPIVFFHGMNLSGRSWSTTPDGREGFREIFLRRGYATYLVDEPRRGMSGRSTVDAVVSRNTIDQMWFDQSRLGHWPNLFEGVQFSDDPEALNQFFRMMTPDVGPLDQEVVVDAMVEVLEKTGPAIFFTHSAGGAMGWHVAMQSENVKAIVALEPGSFVFPEGERPEPIIEPELFRGATDGTEVPLEDFEKLTEIPIVIYLGDYFPEDLTGNPSLDYWRATKQRTYEFAECINRHGGNATVVDLPSIGITGNTHFLMSDLNNAVIAEEIFAWLRSEGLDN